LVLAFGKPLPFGFFTAANLTTLRDFFAAVFAVAFFAFFLAIVSPPS
jgi:hypothetical protein